MLFTEEGEGDRRPVPGTLLNSSEHLAPHPMPQRSISKQLCTQLTSKKKKGTGNRSSSEGSSHSPALACGVAAAAGVLDSHGTGKIPQMRPHQLTPPTLQGCSALYGIAWTDLFGGGEKKKKNQKGKPEPTSNIKSPGRAAPPQSGLFTELLGALGRTGNIASPGMEIPKEK